MKTLWRTFAVVGVGEIDDGAFPSLAHAATRVIFEDLCVAAEREMTFAAAKAWLDANITDKIFRKHLGLDVLSGSAPSPAAPAQPAFPVPPSRGKRSANLKPAR